MLLNSAQVSRTILRMFVDFQETAYPFKAQNRHSPEGKNFSRMNKGQSFSLKGGLSWQFIQIQNMQLAKKCLCGHKQTSTIWPKLRYIPVGTHLRETLILYLSRQPLASCQNICSLADKLCRISRNKTPYFQKLISLKILSASGLDSLLF